VDHKKIAVFTSIRSEYGLLSPLIRKLHHSELFELQLLVGGAHLLEEFGMTIDEIRKDRFPISCTFNFLTEKKRKDALSYSLSILQKQFGEYILKFAPDLMVLMGDRIELMPVATACLLYNVPLAHISGGEITEGAQDNQVRHAITKMAHIHFPATEEYKSNIMRMGEEEWRICVSGEPGLDLLNTINYIPKTELYRELKLDARKKLIICTFHPETISRKITPQFVQSTLEQITSQTGYQVLVTAANFDQGGTMINSMLEELSANNKNIIYVKSLGQRRYYSVLKFASLMLGNSSSGILEAQSFNLPVVNVGDRQKGRTINPNVCHVTINVREIIKAIDHVMTPDFKSKYHNQKNIFGDGTACEKIMRYLEKVDFEKLIYKKTIFN
jgi:GDP/UDP-N,N'-diacetylbacillosamine 2-epimerase (hydrolysing)